jgi:5-methylcytosine-specific restriction protein A
MPYKDKHSCKYPSCPKLTDSRYCGEHKKLIDNQYNKYQRDPLTKKRYGREWKQIRDRYIAAHPLCEECKNDNRLTPAKEVHHILRLSAGGDNSENNLMALCKSCHSTITGRDGSRWG